MVNIILTAIGFALMVIGFLGGAGSIAVKTQKTRKQWFILALTIIGAFLAISGLGITLFYGII